MKTLVLSKQRRGFLIPFLCFFIFTYRSQTIPNLVNNYSFEDTIKCPDGAGAIIFSEYWFNPVFASTPDYFNSCANFSTVAAPNSTVVGVPLNFFGFQMAKTGNAYAGFAIYCASPAQYRENIKNKLKRTLNTSKSYCVTYYVNLAEYSRFSTANIGFYFSNDSIINGTVSPPSIINVTPAYETPSLIGDTINWIKAQGTYTANGNENFITFGNFRNDASTIKQQVKPLINIPYNDGAYYYIDDISVVEIGNADAGLAIIKKCAADSVILGTDSAWDATYSWQGSVGGWQSTLSCTNCPNPVAKPLVTTKYYLTKQQCNVTTTDSVIVSIITPTTQARAGNDTIICLGDAVQIGTKDSLAFTSYVWFQAAGLSCTNCATPIANPTVATIYNLQRKECSFVSNDAVKITIDDCIPTFTAPNIFTPNYDGVNETWYINFSTINAHIKNFTMNIYDRWGLPVYTTVSSYSIPATKWDGHTMSGMPCSEGVYFYIVIFNINDEQHQLKGYLSLFR